MRLTFKSLPVGARFEFPPLPFSRCAMGPYVKTSARCYRDDFEPHRTDDGRTRLPVRYRVGSTSAEVRRLS